MHQSRFPEAEPGSVRNDKVISQLNADALGRRQDLAGELDVGIRWDHISVHVVVRQDHGSGAVRAREAGQSVRRRPSALCRTLRDGDGSLKHEAAIEQQDDHPGLLGRAQSGESAHGSAGFRNTVTALHWRLVASCDLCDGQDLSSLRRTQAQVAEGRLVELEEASQADPLQAAAQQSLEQLIVRHQVKHTTDPTAPR
jgi:hypothetical protein